ncbi:MAG: hypothetical protein FWF96_03505, partial [Kiritimatiellaeota bacterium]|nr:hypothetical protein [Kiritimatiellota bacterium]
MRPDLTDTMGAVYAASGTHASYPAGYAFDNNMTRPVLFLKNQPPCYVIYAFAGPVVVDGYSVSRAGAPLQDNHLERTVSNWSLEGSDHGDNNGTWDEVDRQSGQIWTSLDTNIEPVTRYYEVTTTNNIGYRFWRFSAYNSNNSGDYIGVGELEYFGRVPVDVPHITLLKPTYFGTRNAVEKGKVTLRGDMDAGGEPAGVFIAHGDAPESLSVTNHLSSPVTGPFDLVLDGLEGGRPYWFIMVATNSVGRYETTPQMFCTRGDDITSLALHGNNAVTAPDSAPPRLGYTAFDNDWGGDNNRWFENLAIVGFPQNEISITYTFPKKTVLTGYGIYSYYQYVERNPKTWRMEGSNGDKILGPWTVVDRREDQPGWQADEPRFFGISPTPPGFTHWRLSLEELQSHGSTYSQIAELEYFGRRDVSGVPQPAALPHEQLGNGAVKIKGEFVEGGDAGVRIVYGGAPDNLVFTNDLGFAAESFE